MNSTLQNDGYLTTVSSLVNPKDLIFNTICRREPSMSRSIATVRNNMNNMIEMEQIRFHHELSILNLQSLPPTKLKIQIYQSKISSLTCQCCTARIFKSTTIACSTLTTSSDTIRNPAIGTICWKEITSCCTFRIVLATTIPCSPSTISKWCQYRWSSPNWAEIFVEWYSSVITTGMTNCITIVNYRSVQIKRIVWTYSMDHFDR